MTYTPMQILCFLFLHDASSDWCHLYSGVTCSPKNRVPVITKAPIPLSGTQWGVANIYEVFKIPLRQEKH